MLFQTIARKNSFIYSAETAICDNCGVDFISPILIPHIKCHKRYISQLLCTL